MDKSDYRWCHFALLLSVWVIKTIVFDFDGVIIESADIKTEAFRKLFSNYPDKVDKIVQYHSSNMGISRYLKFKYFYENILKEHYSEEIGIALGKIFSELVLEEILKAPFVAGMEEFLEGYYKRYLMFIVSGTPEVELLDITKSRGLERYFQGIFGSPRSKSEILNDIMKKHHLNKSEVVFIGDAESDMNAADKIGIFFIARLTDYNKSLENRKWKIKNIRELGQIIRQLHFLKCEGLKEIT